VELLSLIKAIRESWSQDTAGSRYAATWSTTNPALGQCTVSALLIQDFFGGELVRMTVIDEGVEHHHTMNRLPGGILLDATAGGLGPLAMYAPRLPETREETLDYQSTRDRYLLLKERVSRRLLTTEGGDHEVGTR